MTDHEVAALLAADVPAHLATLDDGGYPHITPLWFLHTGAYIVMTSLPSKPHVQRLMVDARAGICIQREDPEREDGQRPNCQVRIIGDAELTSDSEGHWTYAITQKYVTGAGATAQAQSRAAQPRMAIRVPAIDLLAVASV